MNLGLGGQRKNSSKVIYTYLFYNSLILFVEKKGYFATPKDRLIFFLNKYPLIHKLLNVLLNHFTFKII